MTILRLALASLLAGAVLPAPGADKRPMPATLTLGEAVRMALSVHPQLRRAEAAVREAQARHNLVRAENRPTVLATAYQSVQTLNLRANGIDEETFQGFGGRPIPELFGPFGTFDTRLQFDVDILNLPRQLQQRAENFRIEAQESQTDNAREMVVTQVVSGYFDALRAQAFEATAVRQLMSARALDTLTADRFQEGVASGLDRRRARSQALTAQQQVYEAQAALDQAKLVLAHTVHAEITANYELADIDLYFDSRAPEPAESLVRALQARPDYRAAQQAVAAARANAQATETTRLPRLSVHADYGRSGRTIGDTRSTYRVQGNLAIPIYWGGRGDALRTRALAALDEAEANLETIESEIEMNVRVALSALDSARLQVEAAKEAVRLVEEEADLSLARFQEGVADNSEVVTAQERLARAEQARIRALHHFHTAKVALDRAIGGAEASYSGKRP